MKIHKIVLLFCLMVIIGCASQPSYQRIILRSTQVDYADGVDEYEAIILAQKHLIDKSLVDRLHSIEPFEVKRRTFMIKDGNEEDFIIAPENPTIFEVHETWLVLFRDRENSLLFGLYPVIPFYVELDADVGDIIRWGLKR